MKMGSAFAGIGGFDLGFERAGIETIWQIEKEEFCRKVLARHFPKAKRYTDVEKVCGRDCNDPGRWRDGEPPCKKDHLAPVDIITGGVPCQDVSVAGKRAGLSGHRTSLVYDFARILTEVRPTWFVFENVPGLFSSNEGRDFAEIIRLFMVECGYGISWRVLDSQFFGVAQRRRRVFIVGRLGEPCPPEILFDTESGGGDSAARGEEGTDVAVPLTSGSGKAGHQPGRRQEDDFNIVRQAVSAKWAKGSSGPSGDECHNLVAGTLRENPHNTSQGPANYVASTITSEYSEQAYRGDGSENSVAATLQANPGGGYKPEPGAGIVAFDTTQLTHHENRANPQPGDPCHPLSASAHAPAIVKRFGDTRETVGTISHLDHQHGTQEAVNGFLVRSPINSNRMRDFAELPQGLDSARYRALGNAVTVSVAYFIAKRIKAWTEAHSEN